MKVGGKILAHFESCNSPVDKEGFLFKKGEIKTSYSKRWCVLKGNLLFYKDRAADCDLIGVIVLEGCTIQLCESEEPFAFSLVWAEPGLRTYKFAAEDQAGQESWIKALLSANHNYLALLVMDLENKYRDLLAELPGEATNPFTMPNFSTLEAGSLAAYQSRPPSTPPLFAPPAVVAVPGLSSGPMLLTPTIPAKTTSKRSPKLWPKRNANVVPINAPAPPMGEWSAMCLEEFSKLHEDFGREVKELIFNWSKRGQAGEDVQEENLIDFG
ncbi:sesquipedalian-1-like [Platichthys flesus]|uniref:sesquipedalian-1-like n=1 Tax=Platichthys flesus TaxID=8260 RepID=UPI002DBA20A3|nr:sesquipedalian-1-like [Platichthys flesus]XP_062234789.1 sesquipedalian-1-like [Platichthys flesus]